MRKMASRSLFLLKVITLFSTVRLSVGIECTIQSTNVCSCSLNSGIDGVVDINPLFRDGVLKTLDSKHTYEYQYDPCRGTPQCTNCLSGSCAMCQRYNPYTQGIEYGTGSLNTAVYTISNYVNGTEPFSLTVKYSKGDENRNTIVQFIYNQTIEEPVLIFISEKPRDTYNFQLLTNGPGVTAINSSHPKGHTSGPYPIQRDACSVIEEDSLLHQAGLLKQSSKATVLNFTFAQPGRTVEYFVGVCVSPLPTVLPHCYVIQKITEPNGDTSYHCLGSDVDNQVTDTKAQGWMVLSYTYGSQYSFLCDGSTRRAKIHFFCSRSAGMGAPMYIEKNPLIQDDCFYQFNWPTAALCGPDNSTQPVESQPSIDLEGTVLLGITGAMMFLVCVLFLTTTVTVCLLCGKRRSSRVPYHRMASARPVRE